jgi:inorganic pyrophosphatase
MDKRIQKAVSLELQSYRKPAGDARELKKTHVPYTGTPYQHPAVPDKVILVSDPFSAHAFYYEFKAVDIGFAEELPSAVNPDNKAVTLARLWIKAGSVAVRCDPFRVEVLKDPSF